MDRRLQEVEEIEITPEMIAAGVEAESLWDSGDLPEWKIIDIYRQMERARRGLTANEKPEAASRAG